MTDYLDSATISLAHAPRAFEGDLPTITFTAIGTAFTSFSSLSAATVTCNATAPVGTFVVLLIAGRQTVTSVTDSKGNTYTVDKTGNSGANTQTGSIVTSILTTQLVSGDTWTVNYSAANARHAIIPYSCTGNVIFQGVDQTAQDSGSDARRGHANGGTTPVTTAFDELVLACFSSEGNYSGGNGTYINAGTSSGGGTPSQVGGKYYVTRGLSTQIISGITSGGIAITWAGVTATYKLAIPITDAATVSLALSASSSEVYGGASAYTDANTATLKFTVSGSEALVPILMPIVTQIHFAGTGTGTSVSVSNAATSPGNLVTVIVAADQPVTSVTDAVGNTYAVNVVSSNGKVISIASSIHTTGLVAGGLITFNFAVSANYVVDNYKWTGVQWQGLDQTVISSGSGSTLDGGTTAATAQANELILTAFSSAGNISGGNGTMLEAGDANGAIFLGAKYLVPGAIGSYSISGVSGTAGAWAGATAAYKFTAQGLITDVNTVPITFVPSVVEVPSADAAIATVKLTPSVVELSQRIYTDSGSIYLDLDFGADDCHSILTPHWDIFLSKRWQTGVPDTRWTVTTVTNRWTLWVIGVAIENPCPTPTFEVIA